PYFFLLYSPGDPPPLHSFPTRRSSDLNPCSGKAAGNHAPSQLAPHAPCHHGSRRTPARDSFRIHLHRCTPRRAQSNLDVFLQPQDRKSTRLNSSHLVISYAVFCLKKKK